MKKKENKHILIINGQSMYKDNATGITMRSLFEDMTSDSILELTVDRMEDTVYSNEKFESIQLPHKAMPLNYYARKIMGLDNEFFIKNNSIDIFDDITSSHNSTNKVKPIIKAIAESSFIIPPHDLLSKVESFNPTVIYTLGASFYVHKWAMFFAGRYNIPIVIHYMDNWRETLFADNRIANGYLNKQVTKLERHMNFGLTISQAMAEAYEQKYRHSYLPLMNTVEDQCIPIEEHSKLQLVYAGGLHVGRSSSLYELEVQLEDCKNIKLIVYTSIADKNMYIKKYGEHIIEFRDLVPHEHINEVYIEADILLYIESFDEKMIAFTKYSLSTKLSEYMNSGRPILCFAPDNIASAQYIKKYKFGEVIANANEITAAIKKLDTLSKRKSYAVNGKKCSKENHSKKYLEQILDSVF